MNPEAKKIIARLGLIPLPDEGGFFRRTWTSGEQLANGRAAGSAITFLITPDGFSALHRLKTDEVWHFCAGDVVEHVQLDPRDGSSRVILLGPDVLTGHQPQLIVPGGVWQGARLASGKAEGLAGTHGWSLLGCTMAPAWDENEFSLGTRAELVRNFPAQVERITALTR